MLLTGFPADAFGTNCFIVAPAPGEECVIVDPGFGVVDRIGETLRELRLRPSAVLLTHGHIDHTFSVTPVCGAHGIAAHIHHDDAYRLRDPLAGLDPALRHMLQQQFGSSLTWKEPEDVVALPHGGSLSIAGMTVDILHAPGHTEGSAMFRWADVPDALGDSHGLTSTILAGDVLFKGGIGRTDLPGGSDAAMRRSLAEVVLAQDDATVVFPGHGPATTMAEERRTNPYLQGLGA